MPAVHQVSLPPRYRVVRHIANGGMAAVWAAQDAVLERLVAVKTLAAGYAADPAARRRFTREARAAARVSDHPNVVTVFDIGDHEDQAFIVMEHFAGGTVAGRLRGGEPVPVATALRWLRQTASALDAAHAADIVHRDVKPGNLLLDEHGRLAVGDFGIASLAGETQVTAAGQVLGTAAYLSPEQARGNPATPASDRYSLAVVAYELLCGRKPFDGDTPIAQARAHAENDPPTPTGPCQAAGTVLKHGLAKDPAERPPTATALVEQLEAVLGGRGGDPTLATAVVPSRHNDGPEPGARRFSPGRERDRTPVPTPAPVAARTPMPATEGRRGGPPPEPIARPRNPHRRAWALAGVTALCLAGGAGAALISDDGNGGTGSGTTARADRAARSTASKAPAASGSTAESSTATSEGSGAAAGSAATTVSTPSPSPTAPASDGRSAAQINNAGYAMLPGDPQGALPLLSQAVEKFRAAGETSSTDYAYSLYNYGWALRLAGRPAEAIPYLQERLRISSYKRGTVEQELKTAEAQAGGGATAGTSGLRPGKGGGRGDKHQHPRGD